MTDMSQGEALGRPSRIEHRFASGTKSLDYQSDAMGNRKSVEHDDSPSNTETYGYNLAEALTSLTPNGGTATRWGYDAKGNRVALTLISALASRRLQLEQLVNRLLQPLEVNRLRQVFGKARLTGFAHIVLHPEAAERDAAQAFGRLELLH